jgi:hypothetical protein
MGNFCCHRTSFRNCRNQSELIIMLEESRDPYDNSLAKLYEKKIQETPTQKENNSIEILEVFLKGITEFQNFLKNFAYDNDKLLELTSEIDNYFLLDDESTDYLILIQKKKIIKWLDINKVDDRKI